VCRRFIHSATYTRNGSERLVNSTRAMVVCTWALLSAATAAGQDLACPPGTFVKSVAYVGGSREAWCVDEDRQPVKHGLSRLWHADGSLAEKANYDGGKLSGRFESWYGNGSPRLVANYENGKFHGLFESWRQNGSRDLRATYSHGNRQGIVERWHPDGQPAEIGHKVDRQREGPWKSFWPSGHPRAQGIYAAGKKDGRWTTWYPNGEKESEGRYADGGWRTGAWRTYYMINGAPKSEYTYVADKKSGVFVEWYFDGVLREKGNFDEPRETWQQNLEYDPQHPGGTTATLRDLLAAGRKSIWFSSIQCPPGSKPFNERSFARYTSSGCVDEQGRRQGPWQGAYRDKNAKRFEHTYRDDQLEGRVREWLENGQLAIDCTYVDGALHGDFVEYEWWGSMTLKGRFDRGMPVGRWSERRLDLPRLEAEFDSAGRPLHWKRWNEEGQLLETGEVDTSTDAYRVRGFHESTGHLIVESTAEDVTVKWGRALMPSGHHVRTPRLSISRVSAGSVWRYDGTLMGRGRYREGRKDGPWIVWGRNGRPATVDEYRAGKKEGYGRSARMPGK
jgi:antitoxin component YwqK of YwqJK toxin-antitoxin module